MPLETPAPVGELGASMDMSVLGCLSAIQRVAMEVTVETLALPGLVAEEEAEEAAMVPT